MSTTRTTTVRSVLACIAAGVLGAASLAAAPPPAPASAGASGAGASGALGLTATADGTALVGRSGAGSLFEEAGTLSADAMGDLFRAHVARTAGVGRDPLIAGGSGAEQQAESETAVKASDGRTWVRALPGGDLDGDGLEDVVTVESGPEGETVIARSGVDGTELWRRSEGLVTDLYGFAGPDVTGDGAEDFLLWTLRWEDGTWWWSCSGDGDTHRCEEEHTASYTWQVGAIDGADGSTLWSQETEGEFDSRRVETSEHDTVEGDSRRIEITYDAVGDLVLPVVSGDHDGDSSPDLLLNRVDMVDYSDSFEREGVGPSAPVGGNVLVSESHETSLAIDSAVVITDGATGDELGTVGAAGEPAEYWGLPLGGDATGDGVADIAVQRWQYATGSGECLHDTIVDARTDQTCPEETTSERSGSLRLLDGSDLTQVWEADVGHAHVTASGVDHTADGVPDLLVTSQEGAGSIGVTSGADGSVAWEEAFDESTFGGLLPLSDLDGDAAADVLAITIEGESLENRTLTLRRLTGPTGAEITETSRSLGGDASFVDVASDGYDADGDGGEDIVVDVRRFHQDGDTTRQLEVERALDGSVVWGTTDTEPLLWDLRDLDADGADDLVLSRFVEETSPCCELRHSLEAVSVADERSLWELDDLSLYAGPTWITDDLDGDGGGDLLHHHTSEDTGYASGVTVRNGADLSPLWLAGGPPA